MAGVHSGVTCPLAQPSQAAVICVVYISSRVHSAEEEASAGGSGGSLLLASAPPWKLLTATIYNHSSSAGTVHLLNWLSFA